MHPRVAMQILRHSKIAITMAIYTMVPDKTTRAALKAAQRCPGFPGATPPDDAD